MKKVKVQKVDVSAYQKIIKNESKRYNHLKNIYCKCKKSNMSLSFAEDVKNLLKQTPDYSFYDSEKLRNIERMMCNKLIEKITNIVSVEQEQDDKENFLENERNKGFMSLEEFICKKRLIKEDPPGVYVFHNISSDLFYVGQAKRLYFRVNQHLKGKGNKELYQDLQCGDIFMVKIIQLKDSPFESLSAFEKEMIQYYDAIDYGYNKAKGLLD